MLQIQLHQSSDNIVIELNDSIAAAILAEFIADYMNPFSDTVKEQTVQRFREKLIDGTPLTMNALEAANVAEFIYDHLPKVRSGLTQGRPDKYTMNLKQKTAQQFRAALIEQIKVINPMLYDQTPEGEDWLPF